MPVARSAPRIALTPDDRVLSSLPLYHINGQCIGVVSPLVSGGSIVLPHRFSVSRWWPLVERYRPTWLNVVPTIIAYLLNAAAPTPAQTEAIRGVRFARSASAPLPPEQHRAFEERFGVPVIEAMGLTECASVAFCNSLDPARAKDRLAGPADRHGSACRRPGRTSAGSRRARRDPAARRQRDDRLLQGAGRDRASGAIATDGFRPATWAIATAKAATSSPGA